MNRVRLAFLVAIRRMGCASVIGVITAVQASTSLAVVAAAREGLVDPNEPEKAPPAKPVQPFDPITVARGKQVYQDFCEKCHGRDMVSSGGAFFDLRTFPLDDKQRFVNSVTSGKRAMPAWGSVLKPGEFEELWAYVSSRGEQPK